MSVAAFLAELRSRDIRVWANGDQLRCNAPAGALAPELREQLRQRKSDILDFLHAAEALAHQQRAIVPLQARGNRTPIFAVAGHNGDVFCYRALAQQLGDDQPFYGLQPPGLDGQSEPLASVEELAAYFAGQIRGFQPNGPYVIAGYCAGGTIALELARQLLHDGAGITVLALFGSPFPTSYRFLPQLRQLLVQQVQRVTMHARALASRSWGERRPYIVEKLRQSKARRDTVEAGELDPALVLRARVEQATVAAVRRYKPGFFDGRAALLLPNREWVCSGDTVLRWRSVARDTEQYFGPDDCNGDVMLREPYVSGTAELFRQCRERSAMANSA